MKKICAVATLCLLSSYSLATSIVFNGFECADTKNLSNASPTSIAIQSRFTVLDSQENFYTLRLTGGHPRVDSNGNVCIDTTLGYAGAPPPPDTPKSISLPEKTASVDAVGYFNGKELTITVNSLLSTLTGNASTTIESVDTFTSSAISASTNIFIFDFKTEDTSFVLNKWIYISGKIIVGGWTNPKPAYYFESLKPNDIIHPSITELKSIIYNLE
ncbi:MAG: hypothetical protein IPN95_28350 [Bacteroidetes bacterium]|nr:hypothetical protein [Bacteroidota bacterium]